MLLRSMSSCFILFPRFTSSTLHVSMLLTITLSISGRINLLLYSVEVLYPYSIYLLSNILCKLLYSLFSTLMLPFTYLSTFITFYSIPNYSIFHIIYKSQSRTWLYFLTFNEFIWILSIDLYCLSYFSITFFLNWQCLNGYWSHLE